MIPPVVRDAVLEEVKRRAHWSMEIQRLAPGHAAEVAGALLAEAAVPAKFQGCDVPAIGAAALVKCEIVTTRAGVKK